MLALERTRVGPFAIDQALTVDEVITRHALGRLSGHLLSLDRALGRLGVAVVDEQTADRLRHGNPVPAAKILRWEMVVGAEHGLHRPVRIHDTDGCLVAIGQCPETSGGTLKVEKVLIGQDS
jgi:tRNA U55 pseudouridine synthase TruB